MSSLAHLRKIKQPYQTLIVIIGFFLGAHCNQWARSQDGLCLFCTVYTRAVMFNCSSFEYCCREHMWFTFPSIKQLHAHCTVYCTLVHAWQRLAMMPCTTACTLVHGTLAMMPCTTACTLVHVTLAMMPCTNACTLVHGTFGIDDMHYCMHTSAWYLSNDAMHYSMHTSAWHLGNGAFEVKSEWTGP